MNITAQELAEHTHQQISDLLASGTYKNETQLYRQLAVLADLSVSTIRQFHQKTSPHPATNTLDKMIYAVKIANKLKAA